MTLPEQFRLTITGDTLACLVRSNITPGELGRLLEHVLTGGALDLETLRGWGLAFEAEKASQHTRRG